MQREREEVETGVLQVLIASRSEALEKVRTRRDALQRENMALVSQIEELEGSTLSHVRELLERYGKVHESRSTLKTRFERDVQATRDNVHRDLGEKEADIARVRAKLERVTQQLDERVDYLRKLLIYRDSGQYENEREIGKETKCLLHDGLCCTHLFLDAMQGASSLLSGRFGRSTRVMRPHSPCT
jgi:hypothetical protein